MIDAEIVQNGRKTRAMLSQALCHAAGQARKTRHPLSKARHIRDVASAAATVHPETFGAEPRGPGRDQPGAMVAAIAMIFGDRAVKRLERASGAIVEVVKGSRSLEDTGEPESAQQVSPQPPDDEQH